MFLKVKVKVVQSCLTLCYPMDYTVHGILQARILEWVAFPFSRGLSQPRDRTQVSRVAGGFFTSWANKGSPRILEWVAYPFSSRSSALQVDSLPAELSGQPMCFLICSKVLSALTLDVRFSMTPSSHFWRHSLCSYLFKDKYVSFRAGVPNLFGTRDQCHGRQFFHRLGVWGWFQDDSSTLCLLCTLFLAWCHQPIWQEIPVCSPERGNPCSRSLCNSQLGA